MNRSAVSFVIACLAMSGCAPRTAYRAPDVAVPPAWSAATPAPAPGLPVDEERLARWWESFGDPQLTSLVERVIHGSPDVRTATSRVREARASLLSTRSNLLPTVDLDPSISISRTGTEAGGGAAGFSSISRLFAIPLDASWEADLFGGIRGTIAAARATMDAQSADLQDVLVTLAAEAALDYINVRSLQQRVAIATANAEAQQQTLELTQFRQQAGVATDLDVQQARSNVESTRAQIVALDSQRAQAIHALAVLVGLAPAALDQELASTREIPAGQLSLAIGIPADALRRRPDVRAAERQLAAQWAQVGVAEADLKPTLRLAGSIGLESLAVARLFVPGAAFWSVRPSGNYRVFNRTQLRQNLAIQTERQRQAAASYEARVLSALQEAEDALVAFADEQSRRDHLAAAAGAAQDAADLSLQLYTAGLRDFRDVLDAQRSLLTLQDSLASSTTAVSSDLVRLYKALGGGWATSSMVDVDATPDTQ